MAELDGLAESGRATAACLAALGVVSLAFPPATPVALAAGAALAWRRKSWLAGFPVKKPKQEGGVDPHELDNATGKPAGAEGVLYLGDDRAGRGVWLGENDARQHLLVLGGTGDNRSDALLGIAANALSWGSGFTLVDGKGDVAMFAKVFALCMKFGRGKDLVVLNFMNGNHEYSGPGLRSCRMNPMASGNPDSLTQMIVSLMDDAGGDGAMWKGRAIAMLSGIMKALCWLRDYRGFDLTVASLRDHMGFGRIVALSEMAELPEGIRRSIRSYLTSLPGYGADRGNRQAQTTLDQHGYLEMQFTKILGSMADVYGHIFAGGGEDVDMRDVVLNRRILLVMLPALEKSGDEIANLGKIVVAMLKGMMGSTLGSRLDGNWQDVVENRPTKADSPYAVIFSDCEYYVVDGMALMAAQARSLGFSMVYAAQDIPAMKRLNEKEAASIIANTNTKIFMRTEGRPSAAPEAEGRAPKAPWLSDMEADVFYRDKIVRARMFSPEKISPRDAAGISLRLPSLISLDWDGETETGPDAGIQGEGA